MSRSCIHCGCNEQSGAAGAQCPKAEGHSYMPDRSRDYCGAHFVVLNGGVCDECLKEDSAVASEVEQAVTSTPDFKGHMSLADMLITHATIWRDLLSNAKITSGLDQEDGDEAFYDHELKALDEIVAAAEAINAGRETFEQAVEPAIKWLNDNANPHAVIIVEPTVAVLYTGDRTHPTEKFLKD